MLIASALPKRWDVVRCFLDYPHDNCATDTHPGLVLASFRSGTLKAGSLPIVVVAGGTGVFDMSRHPPKRRKTHNGEIPLKEALCLAAGLTKETKFCFAAEGIRALPWDTDFFRCDPRDPHAHGEPLFGSLDQKHRDFKSFETILLASPEYKKLDALINYAVREVI